MGEDSTDVVQQLIGALSDDALVVTEATEQNLMTGAVSVCPVHACTDAVHGAASVDPDHAYTISSESKSMT
eukprot:1817927-Pyramimonas_sp.AAC.1